MTTPSTTVLYQGGPLHNRTETVEGHPITTKHNVMRDIQPLDGPPAIDEVYYKRTREVRNGAVIFRHVR